MNKNRLLILILALIVMAVTACAPAAAPAQEPDEPEEPVTYPEIEQPDELEEPDEPELPITGPGRGERGQTVYLDEIDVLILESFPVQVNVVLRGNLPDGCTSLDEVEAVREENTFRLTIWTLRDPDAMCTMALVPFEKNVKLDVYGLPAGEYTVVAADRTATFKLDIDNIHRE
ncbi:MAG TPA: hypothetical protein VLH85_04930 [Levilinea sp.]|nr:hypothetical protein [Levilinea sp.]